MTESTERSLEVQRVEFARSPFLAIAIPAVIVAIYLVTIVVLVRRTRGMESNHG